MFADKVMHISCPTQMKQNMPIIHALIEVSIVTVMEENLRNTELNPKIHTAVCKNVKRRYLSCQIGFYDVEN